MTTLSVLTEDQAPRLLRQLDDRAAIADELAAIGVTLKSWPVHAHLRVDSPADEVLGAYAQEIEALRAAHDLRSVDMVALQPDHPAAAEARQKFLAEHTHADFELRFFVSGGGQFYLHADDQVHVLLCTPGDLITVPAGMRHWFDMSEAPYFCAIRFFTQPDGWVAEFSGDDIATRYAPMQPLREALAWG